MYSQQKVHWRLDQAVHEYGFEPTYHSVDQVIEFEDRLVRGDKYIYDELGQPAGMQNLSAEESRWMLNEQLLVLCDAAYALTRYCFVKDEEGVIQRFRFRTPQLLLFDIICDLELRDLAIEIMILKARQLGMSTLVQLLIALRIIFSYGVNAVAGSADQSKTYEMSQMLLLCYRMLPRWLRPDYTSLVESDRGKLMFGGQASGVSFQHGGQKLGIATGSTPTVYHLSEVALYADAVKLIDEGLWKAVHASSNVFGILESTGRGNKGWWADTWYFSRDRWPQSRMCPLFLPWFCGTDIYPKPAWLRARPIPENWRPLVETRAHVAKAELYVHHHPYLARHLGERYQMPREQQWFWEINHEEAKYKGAESSFLQEMAGDDEEALQRSEESVFGHAAIADIETQRERNYTVYGLSGQSIEDTHEPPPEDIDYNRERVPLRWRSKKGDVYRWELIPLHFDPPLRENVEEDSVGKLFVYHPPQPGVSYSVGVDTSAGKGEDSTAISVWAVGGNQSPDVQVAEFASPFVSHVEAFAFVLPICVYYGQFMERGVTRWGEPYVSIEQVASVGDTVQLQMAQLGYSNFHRMARYDNAPRKIMKQKRSTAGKRGWFTFVWSRPLLTDNFVLFARNGWARINSPWLVEEMRHFEVHHTAGGREKMEHEEGEHDDRIFAAAMAIFCPHDMDVLAERSQKRSVESPGALPPVDLGIYRGNVISTRPEKSVLTLDDIVYSDGQLERFR